MTATRTGTYLAVALACVAAASGCGDGSVGGERALEAALARTAGDPQGSFAPTPLPLDGAGPHRLVAEARFALTTPDDQRRGLRIVRTIDRDAAGRFRIRDERTLEAPGDLQDGVREGREAVFDGDAFASRRLDGPWMLRDTLDGGHDRALREAYDLAPSVLGAFGPYIAWKRDPRSGEKLNGMSVAWSAATLATGVAPAPLDEAQLLALRDHAEHWTAWLAATHRPTEVTGAVARREPGGELVSGELGLSGDATVEGGRARFELSLTYKIEALPKAASFDIPDDAMSSRRPRTWRMIEAVLGDDLLPPYAKP